MSGVFAVSRDVFDHELFAPEPFTEREAWIWLIGQAAWRDGRVRVGAAVVDLKRGQCAFSSRFLATRWKWAEPRVRRFLNRLKTDGMVTIDTDAGATRLTICKYNEYQRVSLPTDAPATQQWPEKRRTDNDETDAPATQVSGGDITTFGDESVSTDAGATHQPTQERRTNRRKEEDKEYTEDKKYTLRGADAPAISEPVEAQVYRLGKQVLGKSAGGQITNIRKLFDYQDAEVLAFIQEVLAEKQNPSEYAAAFIRKNQPANRAFRGAVNVPDKHPDVVWVDHYRADKKPANRGYESMADWTAEDERRAQAEKEARIKARREREQQELREMGLLQ